MLILSIFLFSFGTLLTFFGAFKIGQSNIKVSLDESAQKLFSYEVQKFMEKHSTQEKVVITIDDKIQNLFNSKLKEIELASKTKTTNNCKHHYLIQTQGKTLNGDGTQIGSWYDLKCMNCGDMYRKKLS